MDSPDAGPGRQSEVAFKLLYDIFKHLTTLNTGTIVVVSALVEKFPPQPGAKFLLIITYLLLGLSTAAAVAFMIAVIPMWSIFNLSEDDFSLKLTKGTLTVFLLTSAVVSLLAFPVGLGFVIWYALASLP